MLFSPDYHEPLTERDWDDAWVRRRIDDIVADAESAVGRDGLWAEHPDDYDESGKMPRPLYMGAAGMVWGLHELGHDRPDLIRGLYEGYLDEPGPPGVLRGYWFGEAGILLVSHLLDPESPAADRLEAAILRNTGNESNELMWGAPGTMLAALTMHRNCGEQRWADAWLESADELWARWSYDDEAGGHLWTQVLEGNTARYIGPGHGFAGNVLSLWLGRHLLDSERAAELERRTVATATALAVREDGLANWPPTVGPLAHRDRIRTQWCHGAPGMVASLASIASTDDAFTTLLVEAGELTWTAGPLRFGQGLCHGTAGNGLAFMALFERTGNSVWLERARRFALHALEQVVRERVAHGTGRYSLWTGDIGAALMAKSCIEGRAGMPSLDWV
jgi:hypothetical protein